jgi:GT2 family glycosyltransferase
MMNPSVSVVIPNYNGKHLLHENLPSIIAALAKANTDFEIIISDDASADGSVEFIKEIYPQIKTVRSEINHGFSHTANQGIKMAVNTLVLLLNSDIKLKEDYFSYQWKYFEKPDTFGVMGSIWSEDGKHLMDAAKYPVWKGGQLRSTVNYQLAHKKASGCFTLFVSGANALVDRKKLLALNGFDERYSPYYMEDVDLSVRAWRMGWKCYYEEEAVCYHKLSETISKHSSKTHVKRISKRNKFIFHSLHLEGSKLNLWKTENTLNFLTRWVVLDFNYYQSYFAFKKLMQKENTRAEFPKTLEEAVDEILNASKDLKKRLF